jgi:hypothetical protein
MTTRSIAATLITLLCGLSLAGADGDGVQVSATGTVGSVNGEKKSFTLVEDGSGATDSYRPYYFGGDPGKLAVAIPKLTIGEHVTVVYTVKEGRRAISITDVAK